MARELREKVKVTMHLPGGYTKVLVERTKGLGLADGGICVDVLTSIIPPHLRRIGSRFVLVITTDWPSEAESDAMTADQMRRVDKMSVEEIKDK